MRLKMKYAEVAATISAVYNSLIAASDGGLDVMAKLQGLLVWRYTRAILTSDVTGAVNTTADFNALQLVIPANTLQVGDQIDLDFHYVVTKTGALAAATFNFWVKNNAGNKILSLPHTIAAATTITNGAIRYRGRLTVEAIGASGLMSGIADFVMYSGGTTARAVDTASVSFDTTADITLSVGANCSAAASTNRLTARTGGIRLC